MAPSSEQTAEDSETPQNDSLSSTTFMQQVDEVVVMEEEAQQHPIPMIEHDDETETIDGDDDRDNVRQGTIASARFNILNTMVGGGCLSLPLAFQQAGNALMGPILLLVTGLITDFCFRILVASLVQLQAPHRRSRGNQTFEGLVASAFGPKGDMVGVGLVCSMCLFGAVGYSVLLRDMLVPINDWMLEHFLWHVSNAWLRKNMAMFVVVVAVTPACTLQTLTALKNCGAASMMSILILGSCIVFRSIQCNVLAPEPWYKYVTFFPESPRELLNAIPLFISCFVCHYNLPTVHNELENPSPSRVSWWLRSTTWFAVILYMIIGLAGSGYGHCTTTGKVQGNVLLDFDEHDPLLLVGRMCLALTITLAFPLMVIPARNTLLRSIILPYLANRRNSSRSSLVEPTLDAGIVLDDNDNNQSQLQEPLLADEERPVLVEDGNDESSSLTVSFQMRLWTALVIFWVGAAVASCVQSIDVVWDLLGSSLSILLSYLIPCGSYLVIMRDVQGHFWSKVLCWILLALFTPLMFISTGNAIANTIQNET